MDFEYARKLQAELRAVEWAVCEQKATCTAAVDLDVHGRADGTLLRLEIRSGRLCGWSHRACSAERAGARITSRPPDWAAFADRNAGLAASLEVAVEIHPVTVDRLADLAELFDSNRTTRNCHCMAFRLPGAEFHAGWGTTNRAVFEENAAADDLPPGLLAYRDGGPVGWCALGPRSRFPVATGPRTRIMRDRDPSEDDAVWLVPCFFVRVGARRAGTTNELLAAAVGLAERHGAPAIEGWPLSGGGQHASDRYYGTEPLFASCGFTPVTRPSPRRVVMRRNLA